MTRLRHNDIQSISSQLYEYNQQLQLKTGKNRLGIACHGYGMNEAVIVDRAASFSICVVPVTAGLGIISDFSITVCAILRFLGFTTEVVVKSDTTGIALAFEKRADAIYMADDERFVGRNLHTRSGADNSEATGRVYSGALDLMTGGLR